VNRYSRVPAQLIRYNVPHMGRLWPLELDTEPVANKDCPPPRLWHSKISHVDDTVVDGIPGIAKILIDLFKDHSAADARDAWHVFHDEPLRLNLSDQLYEPSVEVVTWIVNEPQAARKRESLARWPADDHIDVTEQRAFPCFDISAMNVLAHRKHRGVGGHTVCVVVDSSKWKPTRSTESERQTACAAEQVDAAWDDLVRCLVGHATFARSINESP
jgi:hypothetical protein